jgi:hypothetical protein
MRPLVEQEADLPDLALMGLFRRKLQPEWYTRANRLLKLIWFVKPVGLIKSEAQLKD